MSGWNWRHGLGIITQWVFLGALQETSVKGPFANDTVSYQYDALGRTASRAINGVVEAYNYDSLGRPKRTPSVCTWQFYL